MLHIDVLYYWYNAFPYLLLCGATFTELESEEEAEEDPEDVCQLASCKVVWQQAWFHINTSQTLIVPLLAVS